MYEKFFGLREKPFSLTPDTDFFYRYSGYQEALNVLLVALRSGEGFVRVVGEVGTGKTLLCRQLLKLLQEDCTTVYLPNPLLAPRELYQAIVNDLALDVSADASVQQLSQLILAELIRLREINRPLVVLLDEAQAMPYNSLEALRLLSNLETEKEKLLHVCFFAQPEFEERLAQPELRQLRQRITFSCNLPSLRCSELAGYLEHRLQIAGFEGQNLFKPEALKLLHKASQGIPRVVNLLAHKSLLAAYGKGVHKIDRYLVARAVKDSQKEDSLLQKVGLPSFFLELSTVVVVAAVTLLVLGRLL